MNKFANQQTNYHICKERIRIQQKSFFKDFYHLMKIANKMLLNEFCQKHARAIKPLNKWVSEVTNAKWEKDADLKQVFPHADYVGNGRYVFNISGNNFRLIALVIFIGGIIDVRYIGTHAEYSKIKNCSEL